MKLCIYGAGGLGQVIYGTAKDINEKHQLYEEIFFLDDIKGETQIYGIPILKWDYIISNDMIKNTQFVIANGEPLNRKLMYEKVFERGGMFATLIHPTAKIGLGAIIESGVVVSQYAIVDANSSVGKNTLIFEYAMVTHDCKVGSNCIISAKVFIGGETVIEDECYIGAGSIIKDRISINKNSIIRLGSVVLRDVREHMIVSGNPAREMISNTKNSLFKKG